MPLHLAMRERKTNKRCAGKVFFLPKYLYLYVKRRANEILQGILPDNAQTNTLTEE